MAEARTDDRAPASPSEAILDANLTALRTLLPQSAERISTADPPESVRATPGRDGRPTYTWTDEAGRFRWLGRTSMPSISSAAMVDAFQDGGRNVLLVGLGEGSELRLLLDRLGPHQAVMVVEEQDWSAGLALRLHDFSEALQAGRMPLFVGPAAWDDLRRFLLDHNGYLMPERLLSWPWFDAKTVVDLSARLLELGRQVGRHRAERLASLRGNRTTSSGTAAERTISLISNVAQPRIHRLADRFSHAAEQLGWSTLRLVLDEPSMVHPLAAEEALAASTPAIHLLIETGPQSLQYQLPPGPLAVVCDHRMPLATEWVKSLPAAALLFVATQAQRSQALETGRPAERVRVLSPAASPNPATSRRAGEKKRVLVLADGTDFSARAAGLHLASHCQLWDAATVIIDERCDSYTDEKAAEVLAAAEKRLKIRLDSEDVRAGLVERIRQALAPAVVHQAYCTTMIQAGVEFHLRGDRWPDGSVLSSHWRGSWPRPWEIRRALEGAGAVVVPRLGGETPASLMDCMASGLAAFVRSHPGDDAPDGLRGVVDPNEHVWRFSTRAELARLMKGWLRHPEEFVARAEAAARHVQSHHTWTRRLDSILHWCGVR